MTKQYKDSLFRSLFSDPDELRSLYNNLNHTNYGRETPVVVNTLTDAVFTKEANDISFTIDGKLVVLVEHQSTINPNMPFRFLSPVLRLFENMLPDRDSVYQGRLVRLCRPEFVVLYNGIAPFPRSKLLRLSDAFMDVPGNQAINLELRVRVVNINLRANPRLLKQHETLYGYAFFVAMARQYQFEEQARSQEQMPKPSSDTIRLRSIRRAVAECIRQGILEAFFHQLPMEDTLMIAHEWRWEDEVNAMQKDFDARMRKIVQNALAQGLSLDQISAITELPAKTVKQLTKQLIKR